MWILKYDIIVLESVRSFEVLEMILHGLSSTGWENYCVNYLEFLRQDRRNVRLKILLFAGEKTIFLKSWREEKCRSGRSLNHCHSMAWLSAWKQDCPCVAFQFWLLLSLFLMRGTLRKSSSWYLRNIKGISIISLSWEEIINDAWIIVRLENFKELSTLWNSVHLIKLMKWNGCSCDTSFLLRLSNANHIHWRTSSILFTFKQQHEKPFLVNEHDPSIVLDCCRILDML